MGENGSGRKIHALTAIVQMLTAEVYGAHRQEDAAHALEEFHELADSGDPLANAIRNELTGQDDRRSIRLAETPARHSRGGPACDPCIPLPH